MRVMLIVGELRLGGAERQALALARGLNARGDTVRLVALRRGGALEAEAGASGLDIVSLPTMSVTGRLLHLHRLMRDWQPDIVHGYLTVGNIAALVARTLKPRPIIVWGGRASDMRMENYSLKARLADQAEHALARLSDLVIVNSEAGRAEWQRRGTPSAHLTVIENGIDLVRFHPDPQRRSDQRAAWGLSDSATVIGHIARIDPMKDHDTFFEALALLATRRDNWQSIAIAPGSEEERLRLARRAASFGLGQHVRIEASPRDVAPAYNAFDLFCSSSAWGEGFSNVIAEALASGLAVVATDVGDARRLIGPAGLCVEPRSPQALAGALDQAIMARQQLSGCAVDRVRSFDIATLAERTAACLEVLRRRS